MPRRRNDNPVQILILGLLTVAGFGALLVWLTGSTPVLRLRPLLERELGVRGVETRFVPDEEGSAATLVVILPADYPLEAEAAREIAVRALERYVELAEQTRVVRCWVASAQAPQTRVAEVTRQVVANLERARRFAPGLERTVRSLGLREPRVEAIGVSSTGAVLSVTGEAPRGPSGKALVEQVVAHLARIAYVGEVRVRARTPGGFLEGRGGRDAPRKPEPPKPESPKPEEPKPESPQPEEPKPESPQPEEPKPESPQPESP